jgi:hypothetical protein
MTARSGAVGVLSLVHPDFLPALYAMAELLVEAGCEVDIFSAASPAPGRVALPDAVRLHDCGPPSGGFGARLSTRRGIRRSVTEWASRTTPRALVACCPFSYLEALRLSGGRIPVIYWVFELYETDWRGFARSPLTILRNRRALHRMGRCDLVCAPSAERAGWMLHAGALPVLPTVVLNCPVSRAEPSAPDRWPEWLPSRFRDGPIVLNTGNIGPTHCVPDLIATLPEWPAESRLVITNVGDSPHGRVLRELAERSPRREDILLLPTIPRADMLLLQRLSQVGVCLMRRTESLETIMPAPNKVAEYVHAGLVVLAFANSITSRLEGEGVAVIIEEREQPAIAEGVRRALRLACDGDARSRAKRVAGDWYNMRKQGAPILHAVLGSA